MASSVEEFCGFERLFALFDPLSRSYIRIAIQTLGSSPNPYAVVRGDEVLQTAKAEWVSGHRLDPVLWTTSGVLVVLTDSVVEEFQRSQVTGWRLFSIDATTLAVPASRLWGLVIGGRCGPIQDARGRVVPKEMPGGRYLYSRGLYFDENSWDGSDIFTTTNPKDGWCFITDRARRCLLRVGAKNFEALRLSDIERAIETLRRGPHDGGDDERC